MGNHIHCMYIMHVISMNVHYTTHNMLCMQHSAICFCGNIEHTTNQAASRPPPHKRSLALLHKNTARCAGHCFITIDITEKCCPITKTTASRILSQVITDNTFSMVPMYILPHRSGSLLCSEHVAV